VSIIYAELTIRYCSYELETSFYNDTILKTCLERERKKLVSLPMISCGQGEGADVAGGGGFYLFCMTGI
jgi:hypothetical protein